MIVIFSLMNRPDQFENDINLKNSPNGAVNAFIPEGKVSQK